MHIYIYDHTCSTCMDHTHAYIYSMYVWWISFACDICIYFHVHIHIIWYRYKLCTFERYMCIFVCVSVFELFHTSGRNSVVFTSSSEAARHRRNQRHRLMHRRRGENLCNKDRCWLVHLVLYNVAWYQIDIKLNGEIDSSPFAVESWESQRLSWFSDELAMCMGIGCNMVQ